MGHQWIPIGLEVQLHAELHAAWFARARDLPEFPGKKIHVRLVEVDAVEQIETLSAKLQGARLTEGYVSYDCQIHRSESRTARIVEHPRRIAECEWRRSRKSARVEPASEALFIA